MINKSNNKNCKDTGKVATLFRFPHFSHRIANLLVPVYFHKSIIFLCRRYIRPAADKQKMLKHLLFCNLQLLFLSPAQVILNCLEQVLSLLATLLVFDVDVVDAVDVNIPLNVTNAHFRPDHFSSASVIIRYDISKRTGPRIVLFAVMYRKFTPETSGLTVFKSAILKTRKRYN